MVAERAAPAAAGSHPRERPASRLSAREEEPCRARETLGPTLSRANSPEFSLQYRIGSPQRECSECQCWVRCTYCREDATSDEVQIVMIPTPLLPIDHRLSAVLAHTIGP